MKKSMLVQSIQTDIKVCKEDFHYSKSYSRVVMEAAFEAYKDCLESIGNSFDKYMELVDEALVNY